MKILNKTHNILKSSSGETIVEVMVAFTLLTIILLIFSQGLAFATNSEMNAKKNRDSADASMLHLQKKLASTSPTSGEEGIIVSKGTDINIGNGSLTPYTYTVDGNTYVVYMPAG